MYHWMRVFADTALVYSALIGRAPTRAEVARITLTPHFEIRTLAERAKIIMEMPAYAARYGLAMPDVDFVAVQNGRAYDGGQDNIIRVDASSLGADQSVVPWTMGENYFGRTLP